MKDVSYTLLAITWGAVAILWAIKLANSRRARARRNASRRKYVHRLSNLQILAQTRG